MYVSAATGWKSRIKPKPMNYALYCALRKLGHKPAAAFKKASLPRASFQKSE